MGEGFDELGGGPGMDVQAERGVAEGWTSRPSWRKWPAEGKERLDAQVVDDGFAGAVGEAPGDSGALLEENRGTGVWRRLFFRSDDN